MVKKYKCGVQELVSATLDMSAQERLYTGGMIRHRKEEAKRTSKKQKSKKHEEEQKRQKKEGGGRREVRGVNRSETKA